MAIPPNAERRLGGVDLLIRRNAELFPDLPALDDRLHGKVFSYGELGRRANRLARALKRRGVEKGDLVAYAFFNEHASIETLFACCLLGAVAVPLNTRLAPAEVREYLARQSCSIYLSNTALAGLAEGAAIAIRLTRGDGVAVEEDYEAALAAESDAPLPAVTRWDDPYMMAMTGGTTGGPKAAVWGHGGMLMDILSVMVHMEIKRHDRTLMVAPTFHAAGLGWALLPVLWLAGTVVLPPTPQFDPAWVIAESRRQPPDYMMLVPAMIAPLHAAWDGAAVSGVRAITVASAPTPAPARKRLQEIFAETRIINGYGMTETFSMALQNTGEWLGMPYSAGEPSLVTRIRIVDDEGRAVPRGAVGHIMGRSLSMCLYYNNDEANTRNSFYVPPGDPEQIEYMATGDMGFLDDNGILTLVDRAKDVIISGGENVHSVEVESILSDHDAVREAAVIGLPDEVWGERVVGVVVKSDPEVPDADLARALIANCRARLARYKVPKQLAFVAALPRSPFGKVLKRDMVKMDYPAIIDVAALDKETVQAKET